VREEIFACTLHPLHTNFNVETEDEARGTVVTVSGELDIASSTELERVLDGLQETRLVVIDLRKLDFVDSTGLGVLVRAHQHALENGNRVALVRGPGQVDRLLGLTGLEAQLLIADTVEELLDLEVTD
jgi:anti-anti-sigma factor